MFNRCLWVGAGHMWGRPDVIDYTGEIRVGDEVEIRVYEEPVIRLL